MTTSDEVVFINLPNKEGAYDKRLSDYEKLYEVEINRPHIKKYISPYTDDQVESIPGVTVVTIYGECTIKTLEQVKAELDVS